MIKTVSIKQWVLATKTKEEIQEFYKNKEIDYYLWFCIGGLHQKHPAVIRWKEANTYMNQQMIMFNQYKEKYRRKLIDRYYEKMNQ